MKKYLTEEEKIIILRNYYLMALGKISELIIDPGVQSITFTRGG